MSCNVLRLIDYLKKYNCFIYVDYVDLCLQILCICYLPPITKTIQVRRTRHAGHCWRSRDELIGDVFLWTPTYGQAKAGRPVRTYIQQQCEDTGCSTEDLSEAMNDREKWRERVRDIRASDIFNFLFSHFLILLLWRGILVLRVCVDPMNTSLHLLHLLTVGGSDLKTPFLIATILS